jgi:hypothetical protein
MCDDVVLLGFVGGVWGAGGRGVHMGPRHTGHTRTYLVKITEMWHLEFLLQPFTYDMSAIQGTLVRRFCFKTTMAPENDPYVSLGVGLLQVC